MRRPEIDHHPLICSSATSVDPDRDGLRRWSISRCTAAFEGLDDDHATAAAGAGMLWCLRFVGGAAGGFDGLDGQYGQCEQFAGERPTNAAKFLILCT
jgi:hypothetical protein